MPLATIFPARFPHRKIGFDAEAEKTFLDGSFRCLSKSDGRQNNVNASVWNACPAKCEFTELTHEENSEKIVQGTRGCVTAAAPTMSSSTKSLTFRGNIGGELCTWGFDILHKNSFELKEIIFIIFDYLSLLEKFDISPSKVRQFITAVEHSYRNNP